MGSGKFPVWAGEGNRPGASGDQESVSGVRIPCVVIPGLGRKPVGFAYDESAESMTPTGRMDSGFA